MSTAGSDRKKTAIFRWRGIFALAFGAGVLAIVWLLFGNLWVRHTLQDSASQSLGTEVDIAGLKLDLVNASVELRDIAIADPRDANRNLIEARVARVMLLPEALVEQKIVIRDLTLDSVRVSTHRTRTARSIPNGFAPRAMQELQKFRQQFSVPALSLKTVDTVKSLVLDPSKLSTVKSANALKSRVDSVRAALTATTQQLPLRETVDSAEALLTRLKGQSPRSLGISGTRTAVTDVRRLTAKIDSVRRRVDGMYASARTGVDSIAAGARALDETRKADYAFARGLLELPTIDAPNIGPALFGKVSIDAFDQAMYWTSLAREYAPPGLLPRESPGPKRVRRAGTTVHFVKQAVYPRFHLQKANVTVALGDEAGAARGQYRLTASDVTTEPAIVGRPMRFSFDRAAAGSDVETFSNNGIVDHVSETPREQIELRAGGAQLPGFPVPATPLRAELGRGQSVIQLAMKGNELTGSWSVNAPNVTWTLDSASAKAQNPMTQLVTRVIQSVHDVDLSATIDGTLQSPRLSVRSNLDRAVADGVKSVVGGEVAKAEARVRAQVDSAADRAVAPVRALIVQAQGDVDQRAKSAQAQLDDVKARLAAQLKGLGTGILGLP